MKQSKSLVLATLLGLISISGCATQERVRTYETSEMTNDSVQNTVVEEYVDRNHKRVVNKQVAKEKIRCVGQDGRIIPAKTVMECMKRKGKVVDEVYQEEKVTSYK